MDSKLKEEQLKLAKQLVNRRRDRLRRLHTESGLLQFIAELLISIEHKLNSL